jgi:hypothetical protein
MSSTRSSSPGPTRNRLWPDQGWGVPGEGCLPPAYWPSRSPGAGGAGGAGCREVKRDGTAGARRLNLTIAVEGGTVQPARSPYASIALDRGHGQNARLIIVTQLVTMPERAAAILAER